MLKLDRVIFFIERRYKWSVIVVSAFIIYLAISLVYFAPSSITQLSHSIFNNGGDPQQFIWYYNWWPYALTHNLNPFISKYAWFPNGYNLSWSTSIPSLALIMAPITLLGGAILSFNLVAILSPVLAALSAFLLIYYLTKKYIASLLGGYIYGFSSYELGQLFGHPGLYATFIIPLLILLFILAFRQRIKPLTYVILSAFLLAFELGISLEIFATFILFSVIAILVIYLSVKEYKQRLLACAKYAMYALGGVLVIASPFLYYLAVGYRNVPKVIHPISAFSTNAANLLIPTQATLIGGHSLAFLSDRFTANIAENGAYLGLPILIALGFIFIKYWRNKNIRALSFILIIIGIASLGPKLHLISQTGTIVPLPWVIFTKLPLIRSAQPDRLSLYFFLIAGVILAMWLSMKAGSKKQMYIKYAVVALGAISLIPATSLYIWSQPVVPKVFQPDNVVEYIPKNSNILILPFNKLGSGIFYQYASGMEFTQTGGYVGFIPKDFANNRTIKALMSGTLPPDFAELFKHFCITNQASKIVYSIQQTSPQLVAIISSYRWPEKKVGSNVVVNVDFTK